MTRKHNVGTGYKRDEAIAKLLTELLGEEITAVPFSGANWRYGKRDVVGATLIGEIKSTGKINRATLRFEDAYQLDKHGDRAGKQMRVFIFDFVKPVVHTTQGEIQLTDEQWIAVEAHKFARLYKAAKRKERGKKIMRRSN